MFLWRIQVGRFTGVVIITSYKHPHPHRNGSFEMFFCLLINHNIQKLIIVIAISVQDVQEEGRHAIDDPGSPNAPEIPPEDYTLRMFEPKFIKINNSDIKLTSLVNFR